MPVNMDPSNKRRRIHPETATTPEQAPKTGGSVSPRQAFGEETDVDREKDLADAELKNLWDATEVIDMDKV
ncbi:MAG: hypothetical protein HY038_08330 [Nitrospirae bacterium]|nr:hypothetical protein [Nitrospirota bacterium]